MQDYSNLFASIPVQKELEYTGNIMHRNTPVARIENNEVISCTSEAPLYIQCTKNFRQWLSNRAIDSHRANSRILKRMLRLALEDDTAIVLASHAATITDTYWCKADSEKVSYEDIEFDSDALSETALSGKLPTHIISTKTPELTTIGSYEKCWKYLDGHWNLIKFGTRMEVASEIFTYNLGTLLGFRMAKYYGFRGGRCVRTSIFLDTAQYDLEPMHSIVGDNEDYITTLEVVLKISPMVAKEFLDIIFLDTIVRNPDRHTFNYGLLRNVLTGHISHMAPNFDNNLSLFAVSIPENCDREKDTMVRLFCEAVRFASKEVEYTIPRLTNHIIASAYEQTPFLRKQNLKEKVTEFCLSAYKQILQNLNG